MDDAYHIEWLKSKLPQHKKLAAVSASLIENLLSSEGVEYLSVTYRSKSMSSALEKIKRKSYDDPAAQLTDLSGVRVITYLESQAILASQIIKKAFHIDERNSADRSNALGSDRVGYRSNHFVCSLGEDRKQLPEYKIIGELKFEVQIRTILQHAWAELAHDRSFKFNAALPESIQRKLNLHSAMLEIVDGAFQEISDSVDRYKESLENKSITEISNTPVDSISAAKLITDIAKKNRISLSGEITKPVVQEIIDFGIATIGDLQDLATKDFISDFKKHQSGKNTAIGFVRSMMMFKDAERYLEIDHDWKGMTKALYGLLKERYGEETVERLLERHEIMMTE
ncbi:GTP pyrophosphokinase [Mesorhizobium sp. M2C.T.Ca.TU.002.02.1.1]|uniref:GTP pyrophosphokinase n=1 Tax=Mesorhizobium sp. M2C.T.Ca.TU.002.02.1.1 TaxID=2496788 RepID=UPI000FCBAC2C|nr:GTP pyrophosphokinase [Mesorhizobium sp. M2C.T.Ca.TU.002.02.1.1]RUU60762.1 GTP pyrophosphokinase [Mesorhizobium sp. M2C.T.Ca.TU.002.02.1.1]RUU68642.1 GTP pyrophosphokinase [Mesorhizobium sp. M2C.T.Ca.TU.009.01.2.1]